MNTAPLTIIADTGSEAYVRLLGQLIKTTSQVSPRGQATRERTNATVWIESLEDAHVLNTTRKVSQRIMATETMQLLAGLSSLEQLDLASGGRFSRFADEGRLRGAYGPRIYRQLPKVVQLLKRDPDTRQAVITIWNGTEHDTLSRDVPCTQSVQFLVRDGKLHVRVLMRSSDVFLGIPYDWVMFSRLGMAVASVLGLRYGSYTHTAGSQHLYEANVDAASDIVSAGVLDEPRGEVPPLLTRSDTPSLGALRVTASIIVTGFLGLNEPSASATWYRERVPQLDEARACSECRYVLPREVMVTAYTCQECWQHVG